MRKLRDIIQHLFGPLLALSLTGGAAFAPESVPAQTVPSWTFTGDLNTARYRHTATLLPNGKVLVAGSAVVSCAGAATNGAELYDPLTGTWSYTGTLIAARFGHTATLLRNGQVLVAAGHAGQISHNTAELYDPATGVWRRAQTLTEEERS